MSQHATPTGLAAIEAREVLRGVSPFAVLHEDIALLEQMVIEQTTRYGAGDPVDEATRHGYGGA